MSRKTKNAHRAALLATILARGSPAGTLPLQEIRLSPWASLAADLESYTIVAEGAGPDETLYVLAAPAALLPPRPRWKGGRQSFAFEYIDAFRLLRVEAQRVTPATLPNPPLVPYFLQPLPHGDMLLLGEDLRAPRRQRGTVQGYVVTAQGGIHPTHDFGEGVRAVQTTADGGIWLGYEMLGGPPAPRPAAVAEPQHLMMWDPSGHAHYPAPAGLPLAPIVAVVGLNVMAGTDVWCYYESVKMDHHIVHLRGRQIAESWRSPVADAEALAVWPPWILFYGGQSAGLHWNEEPVYQLVELGPQGSARVCAQYRVCDEAGTVIVPEQVLTRGRSMFLRQGTTYYRINVATLVPPPAIS